MNAGGILRLGWAIAVVTTLVAAPAADARVTRIQITTKESPTFGGYQPAIKQDKVVFIFNFFDELKRLAPVNQTVIGTAAFTETGRPRPPIH